MREPASSFTRPPDATWKGGVWSVHIVMALALGAITGCAKPNQANILLRKENQILTKQVEQLRQQLEMDRVLIAGLQARPTTIPSLPADELDKLFTTHGLQFGRLKASK